MSFTIWPLFASAIFDYLPRSRAAPCLLVYFLQGHGEDGWRLGGSRRGDR